MMDMRGPTPLAPATRAGVLRRLSQDIAGNTMMLVAAALIPLTAMIGSGVDMARTYMVKSRLQQACDAGALAGRKYMTGTTFDSTASTRAQAFFGNNFPTGTFGTTNLAFTPVRTNDGQVQGTASVRVPMAVMSAFGYNQIDLNVTCQARLEVANTDVMMVLDVTGSMAACPNGSGSCAGGTGSKIEGLRAAVVDFYDTVAAATNTDSRFRLGFVPYSSAVNMGIDPLTGNELLDAAWMVDDWNYQSRVANMDLDGWTGTTSFGGWNNQTFGSSISNANCTKYGRNESFSGYTPAGTTNVGTDNSNPNNAQAPGTTYSETQPTDVRRNYERVTNTYTGNQVCTRRWRQATTSYVPNGRFAFSSWDYKPVNYNVSTFRTGTPVEVYTASAAPSGSVTASGSYNMMNLITAPGSSITGTSAVYDGCVEERDTVGQANYNTIPAGAWDLDVQTTPSNRETSWRPMWQEIIYDRNNANPEIGVTTNRTFTGSSWCPVAASHLAERSRNDVQDYVDSLLPTGNTFHDLGMAWGVRMISPFGMWAANNTTAPNGLAITRHIIFMTDGDMYTPPAMYNAHGYEESDKRVWGNSGTPTLGGLIERHNARFQALCNIARASNNLTVWTVAFGTSNPPTLVSCADSGKSFVATNTADLRAQFQQIASNIAKLRLSQ